MDSNVNKCLVENKISLCMASYYEYGNFGDLLSRYVVEKLSGKAIFRYSEDNTYHLCAIGSILERNEICSNTVVWGSGFLSPQPLWKIYLTKFRQLLRKKTGKPYYFAVRGVKTRNVLLSAGYKCPDVFGDPALLMPILYSPNETNEKYDVGLILHRKHKSFINIFTKIKNVKIIDIERSYEDLEGFIDEVSSCKTIVSSSLHGIVIANAYKIPCVRLVIKGYPLGKSDKRDLFKFEDYLSGLNANKYETDNADYVLNNITISHQEYLDDSFITILENKITTPQFRINLTSLVKAFPFLTSYYRDKEFII